MSTRKRDGTRSIVDGQDKRNIGNGNRDLPFEQFSCHSRHTFEIQYNLNCIYITSPRDQSSRIEV